MYWSPRDSRMSSYSRRGRNKPLSAFLYSSSLIVSARARFSFLFSLRFSRIALYIRIRASGDGILTLENSPSKPINSLICGTGGAMIVKIPSGDGSILIPLTRSIICFSDHCPFGDTFLILERSKSSRFPPAISNITEGIFCGAKSYKDGSAIRASIISGTG